MPFDEPGLGMKTCSECFLALSILDYLSIMWLIFTVILIFLESGQMGPLDQPHGSLKPLKLRLSKQAYLAGSLGLP